jgi:hypothetical protein
MPTIRKVSRYPSITGVGKPDGSFVQTGSTPGPMGNPLAKTPLPTPQAKETNWPPVKPSE